MSEAYAWNMKSADVKNRHRSTKANIFEVFEVFHHFYYAFFFCEKEYGFWIRSNKHSKYQQQQKFLILLLPSAFFASHSYFHNIISHSLDACTYINLFYEGYVKRFIFFPSINILSYIIHDEVFSTLLLLNRLFVKNF